MSAPAPTVERARLQDALLAALYRHGKVGAAGHFLGIGLLLWVFAGRQPGLGLGIWSGAIAVQAMVRLLWTRRWERRKAGQTLRPFRLVMSVASLCGGLAWGLGTLWATGGLDHQGTAQLLVILAGVSAASMITLSADRTLVFGFLLCTMVPGAVGLLLSPIEGAPALGLMCLVYLGFCLVGARHAHASIRESIVARLELEWMGKDLASAKSDLEDAWQRSEVANRLKDEFLANVSHELRTPLNGVLGMSDLLLQTELDDEQQDYAGIVQRSAESLLFIINDILDFSKSENGTLDLEEVCFDPAQVFDDVAAQHAMRAHRKGLEFLLDYDPRIPRATLGDPARLGQILHGLVSNAVKFTDAGTVTLRARLASTPEGARELVIQVEDTGIGLDESEYEDAFERFRQVDGSFTRRAGGTGLGLSLTQNLVASLDGRIEVRSSPGDGSCFTLHLPLRTQEAAETLDRRGTVLLIHPSGPQSAALARRLWWLGFEVRHADDLERAVGALDAWDPASDLRWILVDGGYLALSTVEGRLIGLAERTGARLVALLAPDRRKDSVGPATPTLFAPYSSRDLRALLLGESEPTTPQPPSRLTAPLRRADAGPAPPWEPAATPAGRSGPCILLAEDNPTNARLATRILERAGYRVVHAADGSQAVAAFERNGFDLILMDVQMPEMDGLEATRRIRATERGREIPIVALTAHAMPDHRRQCLEAGMEEFLTKPLNRSTLEQTLSRICPVGGPAT